jgi:hypothetical protein
VRGMEDKGKKRVRQGKMQYSIQFKILKSKKFSRFAPGLILSFSLSFPFSDFSSVVSPSTSSSTSATATSAFSSSAIFLTSTSTSTSTSVSTSTSSDFV